MNTATKNRVITSNSYVYGITAAEAITGRKVTRTEVWGNAIQIQFKSGSPKLYSKKIFGAHFADSRRKRSEELESIRITEDRWAVQSARSESVYGITKTKENFLYPRLNCTCKDWETQQSIDITTPCCKHIYAVLRSSFDEWNYTRWMEAGN